MKWAEHKGARTNASGRANSEMGRKQDLAAIKREVALLRYDFLTRSDPPTDFPGHYKEDEEMEQKERNRQE